MPSHHCVESLWEELETLIYFSLKKMAEESSTNALCMEIQTSVKWSATLVLEHILLQALAKRGLRLWFGFVVGLPFFVCWFGFFPSSQKLGEATATKAVWTSQRMCFGQATVTQYYCSPWVLISLCAVLLICPFLNLLVLPFCSHSPSHPTGEWVS